jgi:flavin-binding protein dodecin
MTKKLLSSYSKEIYKMIETLASSDAAVAKHLGKAVYTVDEVKTIDTQDQDL